MFRVSSGKGGAAAILCVAVVCGLLLSQAQARGFGHFKNRVLGKARNVIFMVPDGMGLSYVTAARILKNGPNGEPLAMEQFPQIGYQRTHSADSTVTDSAAAGSAWACGEKFNNKEISCHTENLMNCQGEIPETILEIAEDLGKATGLVASSQISHATPAAFGSHVPVRYCGAEIARQYIEETEVEVVLGGGVYKTSSDYNCQQFADSFNNLQSNEAIAERAAEHGYEVVGDERALIDAVASGSRKVLGMFTEYRAGKTPELFRLNEYGLTDGDGNPFPEYPAGEPTLAGMTEAALDTLEMDQDGFFLMVEGSQIDWAGHGNALEYQMAEMLAFDEAVEVVQEWLDERPARKHRTLVVVVGDHDTGGFGVNGPYGSLSEQGDLVEDGWTSGGHTAVDTVIWSQGPGSRLLGGPVDNTDLFGVMKKAMGERRPPWHRLKRGGRGKE
jgi:alkaline phosphatase